MVLGMEKLQKYLEGKKDADFARKIGISQSFLSQIKHGHRKPPLHVAGKIHKLTKGKVPSWCWEGEDT